MHFTTSALALLFALTSAAPAPTATAPTKTATATASGPTFDPSNPPRLRSGGFVSSCHGQHLTFDDRWYLTAECGNYQGNDVATRLHLGDCFGNDAGQIVYEKNGAFGNSCTGEALLNGHTLSASCQNGRGSSEHTAINLNAYIGNIGGRLSR